MKKVLMALVLISFLAMLGCSNTSSKTSEGYTKESVSEVLKKIDDSKIKTPKRVENQGGNSILSKYDQEIDINDKELVTALTMKIFNAEYRLAQDNEKLVVVYKCQSKYFGMFVEKKDWDPNKCDIYKIKNLNDSMAMTSYLGFDYLGK